MLVTEDKTDALEGCEGLRRRPGDQDSSSAHYSAEFREALPSQPFHNQSSSLANDYAPIGTVHAKQPIGAMDSQTMTNQQAPGEPFYPKVSNEARTDMQAQQPQFGDVNEPNLFANFRPEFAGTNSANDSVGFSFSGNNCSLIQAQQEYPVVTLIGATSYGQIEASFSAASDLSGHSGEAISRQNIVDSSNPNVNQQSMTHTGGTVWGSEWAYVPAPDVIAQTGGVGGAVNHHPAVPHPQGGVTIANNASVSTIQNDLPLNYGDSDGGQLVDILPSGSYHNSEGGARVAEQGGEDLIIDARGVGQPGYPPGLDWYAAVGGQSGVSANRNADDSQVIPPAPGEPNPTSSNPSCSDRLLAQKQSGGNFGSAAGMEDVELEDGSGDELTGRTGYQNLASNNGFLVPEEPISGGGAVGRLANFGVKMVVSLASNMIPSSEPMEPYPTGGGHPDGRTTDGRIVNSLASAASIGSEVPHLSIGSVSHHSQHLHHNHHSASNINNGGIHPRSDNSHASGGGSSCGDILPEILPDLPDVSRDTLDHHHHSVLATPGSLVEEPYPESTVPSSRDNDARGHSGSGLHLRGNPLPDISDPESVRDFRPGHHPHDDSILQQNPQLPDVTGGTLMGVPGESSSVGADALVTPGNPDFSEQVCVDSLTAGNVNLPQQEDPIPDEPPVPMNNNVPTLGPSDKAINRENILDGNIQIPPEEPMRPLGPHGSPPARLEYSEISTLSYYSEAEEENRRQQRDRRGGRGIRGGSADNYSGNHQDNGATRTPSSHKWAPNSAPEWGHSSNHGHPHDSGGSSHGGSDFNPSGSKDHQMSLSQSSSNSNLQQSAAPLPVGVVQPTLKPTESHPPAPQHRTTNNLQSIGTTHSVSTHNSTTVSHLSMSATQIVTVVTQPASLDSASVVSTNIQGDDGVVAPTNIDRSVVNLTPEIPTTSNLEVSAYVPSSQHQQNLHPSASIGNEAPAGSHNRIIGAVTEGVKLSSDAVSHAPAHDESSNNVENGSIQMISSTNADSQVFNIANDDGEVGWDRSWGNEDGNLVPQDSRDNSVGRNFETSEVEIVAACESNLYREHHLIDSNSHETSSGFIDTNITAEDDAIIGVSTSSGSLTAAPSGTARDRIVVGSECPPDAIGAPFPTQNPMIMGAGGGSNPMIPPSTLRQNPTGGNPESNELMPSQPGNTDSEKSVNVKPKTLMNSSENLGSNPSKKPNESEFLENSVSPAALEDSSLNSTLEDSTAVDRRGPDQQRGNNNSISDLDSLSSVPKYDPQGVPGGSRRHGKSSGEAGVHTRWVETERKYRDRLLRLRKDRQPPGESGVTGINRSLSPAVNLWSDLNNQEMLRIPLTVQPVDARAGIDGTPSTTADTTPQESPRKSATKNDALKSLAQPLNSQGKTKSSTPKDGSGGKISGKGTRKNREVGVGNQKTPDLSVISQEENDNLDVNGQPVLGALGRNESSGAARRRTQRHYENRDARDEIGDRNYENAGNGGRDRKSARNSGRRPRDEFDQDEGPRDYDLGDGRYGVSRVISQRLHSHVSDPGDEFGRYSSKAGRYYNDAASVDEAQANNRRPSSRYSDNGMGEMDYDSYDPYYERVGGGRRRERPSSRSSVHSAYDVGYHDRYRRSAYYSAGAATLRPKSTQGFEPDWYDSRDRDVMDYYDSAADPRRRNYDDSYDEDNSDDWERNSADNELRRYLGGSNGGSFARGYHPPYGGDRHAYYHANRSYGSTRYDYRRVEYLRRYYDKWYFDRYRVNPTYEQFAGWLRQRWNEQAAAAATASIAGTGAPSHLLGPTAVGAPSSLTNVAPGGVMQNTPGADGSQVGATGAPSAEVIAKPKLQEPLPLQHSVPHSICRFGPGSHMVVVLRDRNVEQFATSVVVRRLGSMVTDKFEIEETERLELFPGPLNRESTHKGSVVKWLERKLGEAASDGELIDQDSQLLLWNLLLLLVRQNGAVVGSEMAGLLLEYPAGDRSMGSLATDLQDGEVWREKFDWDANSDGRKAGRRGSHGKIPHEDDYDDYDDDLAESDAEDENRGSRRKDESDGSRRNSHQKEFERFSRTLINSATQTTNLTRYEQLLLGGNVKQALEFAMRTGLWEHALFIASTTANISPEGACGSADAFRLDSSSLSAVIARFVGAFANPSPLQTLYQLKSGQEPYAVGKIPDGHWSEWRKHLAIILANFDRSSAVHVKSVISMGNSMKNIGRIHAAHFCYLAAHILSWVDVFSTESGSLLTLLGITLDPSTPAALQEFFNPEWDTEQVQATEVYEYALGMLSSGGNFYLPHLQLYKFMYAKKLLEYGFNEDCFRYLEHIGRAVAQAPHLYQRHLVDQIVHLASRLIGFGQNRIMGPGGTVQIPSWLEQMKAIGVALASGAIRPAEYSDNTENLGHSLPVYGVANSDPPWSRGQSSGGAEDQPITMHHIPNYGENSCYPDPQLNQQFGAADGSGYYSADQANAMVDGTTINAYGADNSVTVAETNICATSIQQQDVSMSYKTAVSGDASAVTGELQDGQFSEGARSRSNSAATEPPWGRYDGYPASGDHSSLSQNDDGSIDLSASARYPSYEQHPGSAINDRHQGMISSTDQAFSSGLNIAAAHGSHPVGDVRVNQMMQQSQQMMGGLGAGVGGASRSRLNTLTEDSASEVGSYQMSPPSSPHNSNRPAGPPLGPGPPGVAGPAASVGYEYSVHHQQQQHNSMYGHQPNSRVVASSADMQTPSPRYGDGFSSPGSDTVFRSGGSNLTSQQPPPPQNTTSLKQGLSLDKTSAPNNQQPTATPMDPSRQSRDSTPSKIRPATRDSSADGGIKRNSSWLGTVVQGIAGKLIKGPNQMILPDDSNKTLVYDEDKKKWVDMNADEQDDAPPPPPPSDNQLMGGGVAPMETGSVSMPAKTTPVQLDQTSSPPLTFNAGPRSRPARSRYVNVVPTAPGAPGSVPSLGHNLSGSTSSPVVGEIHGSTNISGGGPSSDVPANVTGPYSGVGGGAENAAVNGIGPPGVSSSGWTQTNTPAHHYSPAAAPGEGQQDNYRTSGHLQMNGYPPGNLPTAVPDPETVPRHILTASSENFTHAPPVSGLGSYQNGSGPPMGSGVPAGGGVTNSTPSPGYFIPGPPAADSSETGADSSSPFSVGDPSIEPTGQYGIQTGSKKKGSSRGAGLADSGAHDGGDQASQPVKKGGFFSKYRS